MDRLVCVCRTGSKRVMLRELCVCLQMRQCGMFAERRKEGGKE